MLKKQKEHDCSYKKTSSSKISTKIKKHPLAAIMIVLLLVYLMAATVVRSDIKTWPFDTSSKYSYDSDDIEVHDSWADLITQDWWDDDWQYRRLIEIDNTAGGAVTDLQVLVELDSSNFDFASAQVTGRDIRFTDDTSTTEYDYWRESFNVASETARFWLSIPSLPAAATMSIYIYYGNPTIGDGSDYENVFYQVGELGFGIQDPISGVWSTVSFTNTLSAVPVVVSTIQSAVDYPTSADNTNSVGPITGTNCGGSDGFADGTAEPRVRNITTSQFDYRLNIKSLDCDMIHGEETVGWIAMVPGTHVVGGRVFRVKTNNHGGGNENFDTLDFDFTFTDVPVVLGQVQSYNEAATCGIRMKSKTESDIQAKIEEDREATHSVESVGFIIADQAGTDDVLDATLGESLEGEVGSTAEGAVQSLFQSTTLQHEFAAAPIVILKIQNDNGGNNGHERLNNITTTGFEQAFFENFYATTNSYDGNHMNDEGASFVAFGGTSSDGLPMYQYRRKITITNNSGDDLTDFPMQIDFNNSNFSEGFTNAKSDGSDIRFTSDDKVSQLSYYLESYNQGTQQATFYIRIPSILNTQSIDIYVYYGNSAAASQSNYSNTFGGWSELIGEADLTPDEVTHAWFSYSFSNSYTATPVLLATMNRYDGSNETHTRVRNLTTTGFQTTSEESVDRDGSHAAEQIGWMTLKEGEWNIGGKRFDAWHQANVDEHYDNVNFPGGNFGATPAVIARQETANNAFTSAGAADNGSSHPRIKQISSNNLKIQVERCGPDESTNLSNETISLVASLTGYYDSGSGGEGSYVVGSFTSNAENWATINFPFTFSSNPAINAQIQTENDTGAAHVRIRNVSTSSFQIKVEEGMNVGGTHTNETIAYIAFAVGDIYHTPDDPAPYPTIVVDSQETLVIEPMLIYARKYVANEPTTTVGDFEEYNLDPTIGPSNVNTVSFESIASFTDTVVATSTGNIRYQISNDNMAFYYYATGTSEWKLSSNGLYSEANTSAEINTNIGTFATDIGDGSFYFKAFLHAPTENDDVALDTVQIDYTVPAVAPDITSISPDPAPIFATVTISGSDFGIVQGASSIYFNGCNAGTAISWSDTSIQVRVPTCATTGPVTVIVGPYISNEYNFTLATPNITFLDPPSADYFQLVEINGSNFGHIQGDSYVLFPDGASGIYASIINWSNEIIKVVVPTGTINGNVYVVAGGNTSNGVPFTITPDQSRWPFTTDSNYNYGALLKVSGGVAETVTINTPPWGDGSTISRKWLYRRKIDFNHSAGKATNFQVELNLSAANFADGFDLCRDEGQDIRFTESDGETLVDYWIESWDKDTQTARIWIEMPNISSDNSVYMYYGNDVAPSLSSYTDTLDWLGQAGTTDRYADETWRSVSISSDFTSTPVVLATMVSAYDATVEAHVRIRDVNIGTDDFEVYIENSRNNGTSHSNEKVSWVALRPGSWFIGGLHAEIGTMGSLNRSWSSYIYYSNSFTTSPAIVAIQQTANLSGSGGSNSTQVRIDDNSGSTTRFRMRLERDDDSQPSSFSPAETTIGYGAFEIGSSDTSLPNLVAHADRSSVNSPNEFYYETIDNIAAFSNTPSVVASIDTVNEEEGENAAHTRAKSVTQSSFQLKVEECRDCSEGHTYETCGWFGIEPGQIYGRKYAGPGQVPEATINAEQDPQYTTTAPTIAPIITFGEYFEGLAGFYELTGFENEGSILYQVTNDITMSNWYWYNGGAWATTVAGVTESNDWQDLNDYLPSFDLQYGTGTFFFKAYLVSDGTQLVQLDGVGIIERSNTQTHYAWATSTTMPPIFYETDQPVSENEGEEYLLGIQIEHNGATGTYNWRLQYQIDPFGTPGAWTNVETVGTDWIACDGPWGDHLDKVLTTDFLVNGGAGIGTASDGYYSETGIVNNYFFASGTYHSEYWFALIPSAAASGQVYHFRIVDGSSSAGFSYNYYALVGPAPRPVTVTISDVPGYFWGVTDDTTPPLAFTCYDRLWDEDCSANDQMRIACEESSLPGTPWMTFETGCNTATSTCTFDITTGPGCNSDDEYKTIWFQVRNDMDYMQIKAATDTTFYDTTPPLIENADVTVVSDFEDYFYGTADGIVCDADLSPACNVYFNNTGGGIEQIFSVWFEDPSSVVEPNPKRFDGDQMWDIDPPLDTVPYTWRQDYDKTIAAFSTDQLGIQFTMADTLERSDSFDVNFRRDIVDPDTVVNVSGYDTSGKVISITSGGWYNYPNPFFEWAEPSDNPLPFNSGIRGYRVVFSTNAGEVPSTLFTVANTLATGPLDGNSSWTYFLTIITEDNVNNQSAATRGFVYRYDTVEPTFIYNDPSAGGTTAWAGADPGNFIDIDCGFGTGSPLVAYEYSTGAAWASIWSGSQAATYTTNWGVIWAEISEGETQVSIRARDEATNAATDTYAVGVSGFVIRKDTSDPDDLSLLNAYDTSGKTTVLTSGNWYNYPNPYFEWDIPGDNPLPLNSGVKGYMFAFSTDDSAVPSELIPINSAVASGPLVGNSSWTYYLRLYVEDNAGNTTAATMPFVYRYDSAPPTFVYASPTAGGATVWYSEAPLDEIDIDLGFGTASPLMSYEYSIDSGTTWSAIWAGPSAATYTTDWAINWATMPEGANEVVLRGTDQAGNISTDTYSSGVSGFIFRRDTQAPDNPVAAGGWNSSAKTIVISSGSSYGYQTPYFEWAEPNDNPLPVNSGVAGYYATLTLHQDIDPATDPANLITTAAYTADLSSSICDATYTLVIKTFDSALPTPNMAATSAKVFSYYFECANQPDHIKIIPQGDSLITVDTVVPDWCFGGACDPACNYSATDLWCSNLSATITVKPDFVKFDSGSNITYVNTADNSAPASNEWSWDPTQTRIILNNDPSASTVSYTPGGESEEICVFLYGESENVMTSGRYSDDPVLIRLSNAPNSGKDITATSTTGFNTVYIPADEDITRPDQIEIKGTLSAGKACVTLSAESVPDDSPASAITVTAFYYDGDTLATTTLPQGYGTQATVSINIRETHGLATDTSLQGVIDVEDIFIGTPDTATQTIVLHPSWSHDGSKIAFISRQQNPCSGSAASGEMEYDNYNVYTFDQSAGSLGDCVRLTSNLNDSIYLGGGGLVYGIYPDSQIAWSPSEDYLVIAGSLFGAGTTKLMYVKTATDAVGLATGSQVDYPPVPGELSPEFIFMDAAAGTDTVDVGYNPGTILTPGDKVVIYQRSFMDNSISHREIMTISEVIQEDWSFTTYYRFSSNLTQNYSNADGMNYVHYPVTLSLLGQDLVPMDEQNGVEWFDPDWSGTYNECHVDYRDKLLAIRKPDVDVNDVECTAGVCVPGTNPSDGANIVMLDGNKNADGIYRVDGTAAGADITKITAFSDSDIWAVKPKWSPNCEMIAFAAWDRSATVNPAQTSIYIVNLKKSGSGFATATLPVESLTDTGVYKIYDYSSKNAPAYFTGWSADSTIVTYSLDKSSQLNLVNSGSTYDVVVDQMFGSSDFDSYGEYILDQPNSQGAVFSPQIIGQIAHNEMSLVQCPVNAISQCPNQPNTPFAQVIQPSVNSSAYLRLLTLSDTATITDEGGLLFQDGIVTAVFPPNVIASDTLFYNQDPTAYCGGAPPTAACPVDPTTEFIVQTGEARDYFPDGTNFENYVRLIFRYCDNDNDGYVDANTESIEAATASGAFTYVAGECRINGIPSSGGTIDEDSLAVYNWNTAESKWDRMDGVIDRDDNIITVYTTHFSRYDTLGFRTGFAPSTLTPLQLIDVHTYPNPYVKQKHIGNGIRFSATDITGDSDVYIEIRIYDIRGSLINTLVSTIPSDFMTVNENGAYTLYYWPKPVNYSGRELASGVYLYYLIARDANYEVTQKGKFSIIK